MPEGPAKDAFVKAVNSGLALHGHPEIGSGYMSFQKGNTLGWFREGNEGYGLGYDWNSPELATMERKNGLFYAMGINWCADYHTRGNGPQTPGLDKSGKVQLDRYGVPAWMELNCDVRALRSPYRIGLCRIVGARVVKRKRSDKLNGSSEHSFDVNCNGTLVE